MADLSEQVKQGPEQLHSRRRFFNWVGQVVAGVSLAGIGIGLTSPAYAKSVEPECTQFCNYCKVTSCQLNANCVHQGHGSYFITYNYQSGCQPNCTNQTGSGCWINCNCPPT